jgi:hypothetical protein
VTSTVALISIVVGGLLAKMISAFVIKRLSGVNRQIFEISLPEGTRKKIEITGSPDESLDSCIQKALDEAVKYLGPGEATPALTKLVDDLEQQRVKSPLSGEIHIALARLYRRVNDIPRAIVVLSEFIKNKEASGERDASLAKAYYNRGCYEAFGRANPDICLKDVRRAVALDSQYSRKVRTDPDLTLIQDRLPEVRGSANRE